MKKSKLRKQKKEGRKMKKNDMTNHGIFNLYNYKYIITIHNKLRKAYDDDNKAGKLRKLKKKKRRHNLEETQINSSDK